MAPLDPQPDSHSVEAGCGLGEVPVTFKPRNAAGTPSTPGSCFCHHLLVRAASSHLHKCEGPCRVVPCGCSSRTVDADWLAPSAFSISVTCPYPSCSATGPLFHIVLRSGDRECATSCAGLVGAATGACCGYLVYVGTAGGRGRTRPGRRYWNPEQTPALSQGLVL